MRSIVTVVTPALDPYMLTSVERIKQELGITVIAYDNLLEAKIKEAGSDIQAYLNFTIARETVRETFRPEFGDGLAPQLILDRTPVAMVTSVTIDDVALDPSEYEYNAFSGLLYRLDTSGYPCSWAFYKSAVIEYSGGYALPDDTASDLEPAIESGAVELVSQFWQSRGRDPMIKSESVPGVMDVSYWVSSIGDAGELPPSVIAKIARFRRPAV